MEKEILRRPATYMLPRDSYCFFCNINPVQVPHRHTHIMYITPVCLNQKPNDCYLLNNEFLAGSRLVLIIDTRYTEENFSFVVLESDTEFATIPLQPRSTNYLELVKMPTVATHFASEFEPSGLDFEIAVELNGERPRMVNLSGDPRETRRLQTNRSMLVMTYWKKAPPY
ncbi:hypothetical protein CRE_16764 [Caenorhabditis remanei]|uniref:Uncharacterized protein n=1 Tax=Caenorhabditis remanei TaxID=31234 RepID=E3MAW8_CAERE|nr:hypothetical protein CRE_16764 [Caenorhabditis remanei]